MNLNSETEIISNWRGCERPIVSIICATYNHEQYIRDAIDGFLSQKTDFPFEVIIHDDASTDNTSMIVMEYAKQYPRIIRPIIQNVNMLSQGLKPTLNCLPSVRGDYIALCEGDDFWIDANKLTLQVAVLDANKDIDICFHSALTQSQSDVNGRRLLAGPMCSDGIVDDCQVIAGDGHFMQTASLMIRKNIMESLPAWFANDAPVGDYFIQIYGAKGSGAYYIDKPMSVYRTGTSTSWTSSMQNASKRISFELRFANCLRKARLEFGKCESSFSMIQIKHASILAGLGRVVSDSEVLYEARKLYNLYCCQVPFKQKLEFYESFFGLKKMTFIPRKILSLLKRMFGTMIN